MTEQKHFSLMAETLDDDLPEGEKIAALLEHAGKELNLAAGFVADDAFKLAAGNLERAYLLNDVLTAMLSAINRLFITWQREDGLIENPPNLESGPKARNTENS
jgi:hypothetical protein